MEASIIEQKLQNFFSQHVEQTFPSHHIMIAAHSTPGGVYFLQKGHVKQYLLTPDGHELVVNIFKPGSFFPMIWAATDLPNNYFFETMEEVHVLRAPAEDVVSFLKENSDVLFDLLRRVYMGIDGLLQQIIQNTFGDIHKKVVATLVMVGKRFGETEGTHVVITQHFTHKELSLISGISRESVTRVLQDLEKDQLIAIDHKKITLVDIHKLEQMLLR